MPTPSDAVAEGLLHKTDGGLDAAEQKQRLLYAMPRAVQWMNDKLEGCMLTVSLKMLHRRWSKLKNSSTLLFRVA